MSNPSEKIIPGQTVTTDVPVSTPASEPKKAGKLKTAFRHPVETVKRHKVAMAASAGVALGAIAVTLLSKDAKDADVDVEDVTEDSDTTDDNDF